MEVTVNMKTLLFVFTLTFFFNPLFSGNVRFYNDSPYPLSATVISQQGQVLGRQAVGMQKQVLWQNGKLQSQMSPQAPYTVIFYCPDGEVYGTVNNVSNGAYVISSSSHGPRTCKPLKKTEKKKNGKMTPEEQEAEAKRRATEEYFDEKPNKEAEFQPKPINPQQWSEQDPL